MLQRTVTKYIEAAGDTSDYANTTTLCQLTLRDPNVLRSRERNSTYVLLHILYLMI